MRTAAFEGSGVTLSATVRGDDRDPMVVFLHGGGQTRHAWDHAAGRLAADGWCTVALDLRGHGESGWAADGDYTVDAFAADLAAVAATLPTAPVLVGASLGGIAALLAQGRAPEPLARALVLVDVAARLEPDGIDRIRAFMTERPDGFATLDEAADAIASFNPHRPRPASTDGLRRVLRRRPDGRWTWHWDPAFMWWTDAGGTVRTRPATDPDLLEAAARSVTVPTLVVRGQHSELLSTAGVDHLLDAIPGSRFADVAGAGHMVAGDRNDAFTDALVQFLGELQAA
jgi:pimeloyl-ACP methyl ester carboxylesterase